MLSPSVPLANGSFYASLQYDQMPLPNSAVDIDRILNDAIEAAKRLGVGTDASAAGAAVKDQRNLAKRFGYRFYREMTKDVVQVLVPHRPGGTIILPPTVRRNGVYWIFGRFEDELTVDAADASTLGAGLLRAFELGREELLRHDAMTS